METITSVAPEGRSNQTRFWLWRKGAYTLRVERRNIAVALVLSLIVLALMILATCVGKLPISISDVTAILLGEVTSGFKRQVLLDIRLPRIFTALFAGAALGLSGAIFQSISRNPLGSPDIIGFTSGAATGALLQIILFSGSGVAVVFRRLLAES